MQYPYTIIYVSYSNVRVYDRHAITGSRDYERAYYSGKTDMVTMSKIEDKMKKTGWEVVRVSAVGVKETITWVRKKQNRSYQ